MEGAATGSPEGDTLLTTAQDRDGSPASQTVPALTILAHPDSTRVGDRLALPALTAGLDVRLSRTEPVFGPPGRTTEARPLEDRHLSRRPLRLTGDAASGSVTLDPEGTRTSVMADGQSLSLRRTFSAAEIERGVVLTLGHRVVLLLHLMPVPVAEEAPGFGLVGESAGMVHLRREIGRLATLDVPVLLCGETGTGKELTARALHDAGPRRGRPYVTVNMATLPPALAAAELFGVERGAYTGADRKKDGLFQRAEGGTLFLDEIGATPPEVQPMLLRALDSREVRPVGSAETLTVDVRVIAATDTDLEAAIAAQGFRAPLYHRLAGYAVRLPALRRRRDDLGRLFHHFLADELSRQEETNRPSRRDERPWPPAELIARLARHDWPGNVRELCNVVRWLIVNGRDAAPDVLVTQVEEILARAPTSAPAPSVAGPPRESGPRTPASAIPSRRRLRKISEVGEEELLATLEAHRFKLRPTAEALGLSRINLYRLIETCPSVRKATDLGRAEIVDALERCDGDREAAAAELRVSLQGLKRQITVLGLGRR